MIFAVVVSGVVIFAFFALAVAAFSLAVVLLERRGRELQQRHAVLEGWRRITSRASRQSAPFEGRDRR